MAIKVGQIRKNNSSYIEPLQNFEFDTFISAGASETSFEDFAITGNFEKGKTYYIRLQFNRIEIDTPMGNMGADDNDPHNLNLDVKLFEDKNDNTSNYQSIGETIIVEPYDDVSQEDKQKQETAFMDWCLDHGAAEYIQTLPPSWGSTDMDTDALAYWEQFYLSYLNRQNQGKQQGLGHNPTKTIELIFTPYLNTAQALVFQLRRVSYDYSFEPRIVTVVETEGEYDVATVANILPQSRVADKIGIQTRPGSLVVINQEPMRVGKSGVLEINNGIKITSVGMVAPSNEVNDFILDYIYTA